MRRREFIVSIGGLGWAGTALAEQSRFRLAVVTPSASVDQIGEEGTAERIRALRRDVDYRMKAEHDELLRRHLRAENAQDLEGTLSTLHPECIFEDMATGQVWLGRDGAAAHYRQWWHAFGVTVSRKEEQSAGWVRDDLFVAEATWTGVHNGDFLIPPSGRQISLPFVVFVEFRDGLMFGERFYYDLASMLRQLGLERISELQELPYRRDA